MKKIVCIVFENAQFICDFEILSGNNRQFPCIFMTLLTRPFKGKVHIDCWPLSDKMLF